MYLIPGTAHVITWSKQNMLDASTYYVRVVIRDVRANVILDTLDLDNVGGSRYTKVWNVPGDPSGQGREIEIEKTIYEDAGYTQISAVYGRWLDQYLIYDLGASGRNSGSTGAGLDYSLLADILKRLLEEKIEKLFPAQKAIDIAQLLKEVEALRELISNDLEGVLKLGNKAENLARLEQVLATATKEVNGGLEDIKKQVREVGGAMAEARDGIQDAVSEGVATLEGAIKVGEESLSIASDKDLTHAVEQFKANIIHAAEEAVQLITESVNGELSRPLKVQAVQDMETVRGPLPAKPSVDPRVERLSRSFG